MTCQTCGADMEEVERFEVTPDEAAVQDAQHRELARAHLRSGAGTVHERQVWEMVARTGIDLEGEWARLECPSGCSTELVRLDAEG